MIARHTLTLKSEDGAVLHQDTAYRLYAWLLEQVPEAVGEALHSRQGHPVSQYVCYDKGRDCTQWNISLLSDEAVEVFSPILQSAERIVLHTDSLIVADRAVPEEKSARDIVLAGRDVETRRLDLWIRSTCSFKQGGKYVIFPQEKLIVQSLVNRWNSFCPAYGLDDAEAQQMLLRGITLSDYSLRSSRYKLKDGVIPGFTGRITLSARLSAPMAELWGALLCWSSYSGLGIKTALGMGGVHAELVKLSTRT